MTTLKQIKARIRRYKRKPKEITVSKADRLAIALQISALHPQSTAENLAFLRRHGYGGVVQIDGVRLVAA